METLKAILDQYRAELLKRRNVVGVGIGYKTRGGEQTDTIGIVAFVDRKLPLEQLAADDVVPSNLAGVATDVVEVGKIRALQYAEPVQSPVDRLRPVQPGCSVGHYLVTAGTLGAIVFDNLTGAPMILSNNHVLANGSNGRDGRCRAGDPVLQPGAADGGDYPDDLAGRLDRFAAIRPRDNRIDAAVARIEEGVGLVEAVMGIGPVRGVVEALPGQQVQKFGRTTGLTRSAVRAVHVATNPIQYDGFDASFTGQIFLGPMSAGGDSGSLVMTEQNEAIGLLFAGSNAITIACPIDAVLSELEVHLRF